MEKHATKPRGPAKKAPVKSKANGNQLATLEADTPPPVKPEPAQPAPEIPQKVEAVAATSSAAPKRTSPEGSTKKPKERKPKAAARKPEVSLEGEPPEELRQICQEVEEFLNSSRSPEIKKGELPSHIESHAEIEPLAEALRPGDVTLLKGNRIAIDLGDKEKNTSLREKLEERGLLADPRLVGPTVTPAGYLKTLPAISTEILKNKTDRDRQKSAAKLQAICNICLAYVEVIDECGQEPTESADETSTRPSRRSAAVAYAKIEILNQTKSDPWPTDCPILDPSQIKKQVSAECRSEITTGEACQLACILAEREIAGLRHSKKRETLFRMRAHLAHLFFEETKKFRKGAHPDDFLCPQKPRYKTSCIMLVRHPKHERSEVVLVKPQSSIDYWGNPEAEKATHALVAQKEETKISPVKVYITKHPNLVPLAILIAIGLLIQIGLMLYLPKNRAQTPTTPPPASEPAATNPPNNPARFDWDNPRAPANQ